MENAKKEFIGRLNANQVTGTNYTAGEVNGDLTVQWIAYGLFTKEKGLPFPIAPTFY